MDIAIREDRSTVRPWKIYLGITLVVVLVLAALGAGGFWLVYPYYHHRQQIDQAKAHLEMLEVDDAERLLESALQIWPDHPETHFLLGRTYRLMEQFADAHRHLREAERLGWPRNQTDFEYLLLEVEENGQLTTETGDLVKPFLAARTPEQALALQALSIAAVRVNRLDRGRRWLQIWVQTWPDDARAHFSLGSFLQSSGRPDQAQPEFERALELQPQSMLAHRWLGIVLVKNGQNYEDAIRHLELCLQQRPDTPDAEVALAQAQAALNQPEKARATLEKLLQRHPEDVGGLLAMAQLEVDADHWQEALKYLQRAENLPCSDFQYIMGRVTLRARVHTLLGQLAEAEALERQAQKLRGYFEELEIEREAFMKDSSDFNRFRKIGLLFVRLGQGQQGARFLDRVLDNNPNDQEVHQALADYFGRFSDPESRRRTAVHRQFLHNGSAGSPETTAPTSNGKKPDHHNGEPPKVEKPDTGRPEASSR